MPEQIKNGRNGWVTKWLVGAVWGLLTTGLLLLSTGVIANDRLSRSRDTEIREKVEKTKDCITKKLDFIIQQQAKMGERVARIEAKIETR